MEWESMLFVTNRYLVFEAFKVFFPMVSLIFEASKQTWHYTKPTKQTCCTVQDKTTYPTIIAIIAISNSRHIYALRTYFFFLFGTLFSHFRKLTFGWLCSDMKGMFPNKLYQILNSRVSCILLLTQLIGNRTSCCTIQGLLYS